MIFLRFLMLIINKIIACFSSDLFWSAASAIGTIGAVVFSVIVVVKQNKYLTKYSLKIKISSQMSIFSTTENSLYTELTMLCFQITNTTNRDFDNYEIILESRPTFVNKLVSFSQQNAEFVVLGDYEYLINPMYRKDIDDKNKFKFQSIAPSTPMDIFFDLRERSLENDNIGWTLKSSIEQGYFSGKIRIKLIDKFGNYYYSSWHKMKHPQKIKNKKIMFSKKYKIKLKVKTLLFLCFKKIYKKKMEAYQKDYYNKRNSRE